MSHQARPTAPNRVPACARTSDGRRVDEVLATLLHRSGKQVQCPTDVDHGKVERRHARYGRADRLASRQGTSPVEPRVRGPTARALSANAALDQLPDGTEAHDVGLVIATRRRPLRGGGTSRRPRPTARSAVPRPRLGIEPGRPTGATPG